MSMKESLCFISRIFEKNNSVTQKQKKAGFVPYWTRKIIEEKKERKEKKC